MSDANLTKTRKRGRVTDLPPCHVCGEKSSGIHYGVNSCEACKAFFYRNSKRAQQMACEADDSCQPDPGLGFRCAACRMRKCLELGMSLGGIKKGRYTFETRARLKKDFDDCSRNNEPTTGDSSPLSPEKSTKQNESEATPYVPNKIDVKRESSSESEWPAANAPSVSSPSDRVQPPEPVGRTRTTTFNEDNVTEIVQSLSDLYLRYSQYAPEYYERVKIVQQSYLEKERQKERMFGKLDHLPINEYLEVYFNTGIDVDGRLRVMAGYYPGFEEACSKFVGYAKELPEFNSLGSEDQVSLLKGAKTSFWMLSDFSTIDVENGLYTNQNYVTLSREEIGFFLSETFASQVFDIAKKLQDLQLTVEEVGVMRAFVIFNPDLCQTEEGKACCITQREILSKVLQSLSHKYHSGSNLISEELKRLEKALIEMNNEGTVQWIHMWSLYQPIVSQSAKEPLDMPAMRTLYE